MAVNKKNRYKNMNVPVTETDKSKIRKAVKKTGNKLLRGQHESEIVSVNQTGEYVDDPQLHTSADDLSEKELSKAIRAVCSFPIYTEETGVQPCSSEWAWIIDPIDGSTQFHHKLPLFTISVALCRGAEFRPYWGLVYAPALNLLYEAEAGKGAYCNGVRIDCSQPKHPDDLFVGISAYRSFERAGKVDLFHSLLGSVKQIRQLGCPSLDLCFVADGRLDARITAGHKVWDIAAAALIAGEAGAALQDAETGQTTLMDAPVLAVGNPANIKKIVSGLNTNRSASRPELTAGSARKTAESPFEWSGVCLPDNYHPAEGKVLSWAIKHLTENNDLKEGITLLSSCRFHEPYDLKTAWPCVGDYDIILVGDTFLTAPFIRAMASFLSIRWMEGNNNSRGKVCLQDETAAAKTWLFVCVFPNPYNIRYEVLIILEGGHERTLFSDRCRASSVLDALKEAREMRMQDSLSNGCEIIIEPSSQDSRFQEYKHPDKKPPGRLINPIQVRPVEPSFSGIAPNAKLKQHPDKRRMIDISLQVDLTAYQADIKQCLLNWGAPEYLFDAGKVYQESSRDNIGLHVTLYEFAHHNGISRLSGQDKETLFSELYEKLNGQLSRNIAPFTVRILHAEIFPDNIFLYCDWTGNMREIRRICDQLSSNDQKVFNVRRMPFPSHCTVWRFTENTDTQKDKLRKLLEFVKSTKGKILGEFRIESVVLTLAELEPFDNISAREIKLKQYE